MYVSLRILVCSIYRSRNKYTDKYSSMKCKDLWQNRVCVGGEHVCALALMTVPSLD